MSIKKTHSAWGIFPVLMYLILQSLSSQAQASVGVASPEEDRKAKNASPSPGRALIYIVRSERPPTEHILPVSLDGNKIGQTTGATFLMVSVAPGTHHLASGVKSISLLDINCAAGKTYFVSQKALLGFSPVMIELTIVSPLQGRKLVNQSRLAGKPPAPALGSAPRTGKSDSLRTVQSKPIKSDPRGQDFGIILKTGKYKRSDTSATAIELTTGNVNQFTYEADASGVVGVEFEYYFGPGLAVGGEYFRFSNSFVAKNVVNTTTGDHSVDTVLVNFKKYFVLTPMFRPFVGVGLGLTTDSLSGDWKGGGRSYAYQFVGGTEVRWKYIGLYVEYKRLSISSDSTVTVGDVSGSGLLTGVKITF